MRFSFSSNAFRNYSLRETAGHIAAAGFAGMEIMCDTPHAWPYDLSVNDVRRIKGVLEEKGLEIANLNAFMMCAIQDFHHPSWIEAEPDFRRQRIDYTIRCIRLAESLGVSCISTEPGGPINGMKRETAMCLFMDGLAEVVPHALNCGVTLLIEPEPGLLIQTADEFLDLVHSFGADGIGLNFDVGHFYCVNEDPCLKMAQLKAYIRHFHLEDIPANREHRHIMLGEGGINIPLVLQQIQAIGYEGYVTVELYPYQESAPEVATRSMQFLREAAGHA